MVCTSVPDFLRNLIPSEQNGSTSACHQNAILIAFRQQTDDGQTLNASLIAL